MPYNFYPLLVFAKKMKEPVVGVERGASAMASPTT